MECSVPANCQLEHRLVCGSLRGKPGVLPFIRHGEDIINVHVLPFLPVSYAELGKR
jgi:hypothetical protein